MAITILGLNTKQYSNSWGANYNTESPLFWDEQIKKRKVIYINK